jgi:hypothetical protein
LLICLPYLPAFADSADAAQARVQASHAALQAAEGDYRQRRARGGLSPGEAADYRSYIAHLRQRFFGACADLATFSPRWFAFNTPCPAQAPTYSRPASIDQAREQTPGERVTAHARDLDASLGEFDEMLLREQERVKAATPPPTASASARGSGAGSEGRDGRDGRDGREGAEDGERGEGAVAGRGPAGEATGDNASASAGADGTDVGVVAAGRGGGAMPPGRAGSQGGGQHRTAQNTPRDIPDGSDDDVVARQLREAAEAERDPELRARLWDEYRRYKRGTR